MSKKKIFLNGKQLTNITYTETATTIKIITNTLPENRPIQSIDLDPNSIMKGGLQNIKIEEDHELVIRLWIPRLTKSRNKLRGQISVAAGTRGSGHQKEVWLTDLKGNSLGKFSRRKGTSSTTLPWTVGYTRYNHCKLPAGRMVELHIRAVKRGIETRIHLNRQISKT